MIEPISRFYFFVLVKLMKRINPCAYDKKVGKNLKTFFVCFFRSSAGTQTKPT